MSNYPKNDNDVSALVGKVIQFNAEVEKTEIDFDCGMKARVVGYGITDPGELFKLDLDFSEFEQENKKLMQSNYYGKNGRPTLKWSETSYYPSDCKTDEYFGYEFDGSDCFEVVDG